MRNPSSGGDETEIVFQVLEDLDAVEFAHFVADLCALQGWRPRVTVADSDTVGDVVASRTLPYPESVTVLRYDDGELTAARLDDHVEREATGPTSKLTVIVRHPPTEEAIELAAVRGVGIVGLGEIARLVPGFDALDVLWTYVENDDGLLECYGNEFVELGFDPDRNEASTEEASSDPTPDRGADDGVDGRSTAGAGDDGIGTLLDDIRHADRETIRRQIGRVFDQGERKVEEAIDADHPERVPDVLEDLNARVEILLSAADVVDREVAEQVVEANEQAIWRTRKLVEVYRADELEPLPDRTAEETLLRKVHETCQKAHDADLDIVS
jgi:hypothetical protein